jgi:hypothetical protein
MTGGAQASPRRGDGRGTYLIIVQGEVERHWEHELRMQLTYAHTAEGMISNLSGRLPDQAALLGVLGWLAMWGYVIVLVRYTPDSSSEQDYAR